MLKRSWKRKLYYVWGIDKRVVILFPSKRDQIALRNKYKFSIMKSGHTLFDPMTSTKGFRFESLVNHDSLAANSSKL